MMRQSYASSAYAQAGLRLRPPSAYAPFSQFRDCRSPSRTAVLLTIRASTFITSRIITNVFFIYKILTYTNLWAELRIFLVRFLLKLRFLLIALPFPDRFHSSAGFPAGCAAAAGSGSQRLEMP